MRLSTLNPKGQKRLRVAVGGFIEPSPALYQLSDASFTVFSTVSGEKSGDRGAVVWCKWRGGRTRAKTGTSARLKAEIYCFEC